MRLALGAAQFGQKYGIANLNLNSSIDVPSILHVCRNNGINTIDTAQGYGDSEVLLGKQKISDFHVITKILIPDNVHDIHNVISKLVNQSQKNLMVNKFHGLLVHNPKVFFEKWGPDLFRTLLDFKKSGFVDLIGISVYTPEEAEFYLKNYQFDLYQIPVSVVDRRFYKNDLIKRIKNSGSQIYARSIFLQGLLINENLKLPIYFNKWSDYLRDYYRVVRGSGLTPIEFCLQAVLSNKDIDKVVVGVDSALQLKQIIQSCSEEHFSLGDQLTAPDVNLIDPRMWR